VCRSRPCPIGPRGASPHHLLTSRVHGSDGAQGISSTPGAAAGGGRSEGASRSRCAARERPPLGGAGGAIGPPRPPIDFWGDCAGSAPPFASRSHFLTGCWKSGSAFAGPSPVNSRLRSATTEREPGDESHENCGESQGRPADSSRLAFRGRRGSKRVLAASIRLELCGLARGPQVSAERERSPHSPRSPRAWESPRGELRTGCRAAYRLRFLGGLSFAGCQRG